MSAAAQSDVFARLLVIDGGEDLSGPLSVSPERYRVVHVPDGRSAVAALQDADYDIIVADLTALSDLESGADKAVTRLARLGGQALLLAVSSSVSVSAAVEALQAGAHDCLVKPLTLTDLDARISVLRTRHDRRGAVSPMGRAPVASPGRLIAQAPATQVVLEQLKRIAPSPAPVFLSGEAGTGKRLAAETLHALGPSAHRPFIAVNCTLSPPRPASDTDAGLSLLAGTEGANALIGAGGGTLYLHEIGALGPEAQARLLALVEPEGTSVATSAFETPLALRVVCSTRQSSASLLGQRTLRQDLFYRLNVLPIHLPPLRQRSEDVAPLATHFLKIHARSSGKRLASFSPGARAYLDAHDWPGNVRELETLIRKVATLFDGVTVTPQMLAAADAESDIRHTSAPLASVEATTDILPMWQQEQRIIEAAIAHYGGNVARAAAALEISPSTIYRKKQSWEERSGHFVGAA